MASMRPENNYKDRFIVKKGEHLLSVSPTMINVNLLYFSLIIVSNFGKQNKDNPSDIGYSWCSLILRIAADLSIQ